MFLKHALVRCLVPRVQRLVIPNLRLAFLIVRSGSVALANKYGFIVYTRPQCSKHHRTRHPFYTLDTTSAVSV